MPNIACLPSKNIIHSAKIASYARRAQEFGLEGEALATNMKGVLHRKQKMVDGLIEMHLERFKASGAELIMGEARFIGARTVEISSNHAGPRVIAGERVFLNLGTHTSMPDVPGLAAAKPMTHIEALELDRLPGHLLVLGGGYVGLELAQAIRRFGSRVTVIQAGSQLAGREDTDVGAALLELFRDEGIEVSSLYRDLRSRDCPASRSESAWRTPVESGTSKRLIYSSLQAGLPILSRSASTRLEWNSTRAVM